ncbi:hypothetical protein N7493_008015 [Penicillium malachiteum]|uniref:Zn(2)-C6 fungal-type domain-containing protein n=1 Tax=Penicillium malachiteum TaxID=1324776 RepID=A0AAD6HGH0_9EURO|nr:hypothetical protein N7493_008015 [Penicillium malachiteum]
MSKNIRENHKETPIPALVERQKRSCKRCNEKKIGCDRLVPCKACSKSGNPCIYPDKRAPRTLSRPSVPELLARLEELETEVEQLRSTNQVTNENAQKGTNPCPSAFFDFSHDPTWSRETFYEEYFQPSQLKSFWQIYLTQVAPIIAILHKPSAFTIFHDLSVGFALEPEHEALLLSVCSAAVASMTPEQCQTEIGRDYQATRQNIDIAINDALNRAKLLTTQNFIVLQAAVLYLLTSQVGGDPRRIWAETAIVIRVAQGQKIHLDGEKIFLSPFDCEMQRRLWWHICILDMLVSEDQDVPRQIHPGMYDIGFPANIDDDDLIKDMEVLPPEKNGCTNITLAIVTAHFLTEFHWLHNIHDITPREQRKEAVQDLGKRMEEQYLQNCDLDQPLEWMTATIARLHLSRAWLFVNLPSPGTPDDYLSKDMLFRTGVEVLEFMHLLQDNVLTEEWKWLWKGFREWHVMGYILTELCSRPLDAESNHAWDMATKMYKQWLGNDSTMESERAKSLAWLMESAVASRATMM